MSDDKPSSSEGQGNFTVRDAWLFVERHSRLLALGVILGAGIGIAIPSLRQQYETFYDLELMREDVLVLRDPLLITQGLTTAFSSFQLSTKFAETFFASLTELSATDDKLGRSAKTAGSYLKEKFQSGAPGSEIAGLASYLNTAEVDRLRSKSMSSPAGFQLFVDVIDGTTYRVSTRFSERDAAQATIVATAAALNALISGSNDQSIRAHRAAMQDKENRAKVAFEKASEEYRRDLPTLEQERTSQLGDLFKVEKRIQALEGTTDPTKKIRTVPGLPPFMSLALGSEERDRSDVFVMVDQLETLSIANRIAALQERKAVSQEESIKLVEELSRLQTSRNDLMLRYAAQMRTFSVIQRELSRIIAEASAPSRLEEFSLARVANVDTPAWRAQVAEQRESPSLRRSVAGAMGIVAGMLTAIVMGLALDLRTHIRMGRFT